MTYTIEPVAYVRSTRRERVDDFWGSEQTSITLDPRFTAEALRGIEAFSHLEIVFLMDQVDPAGVITGARHPRNNPDWPVTGIFAQRAKNRPNRIGCTIC